MFFSHLSIEANTVGKTWNTTDYPYPVGKFTYPSLFISWYLLSFSNPKISHFLPHASSSQLSPSSAILVFLRIARSPRKPHKGRVSSTKITAKLWLVKKWWRHGNSGATRDHRHHFLGRWNNSQKKKTSAPHRLPGQNCQKKSCQSMKQKLWGRYKGNFSLRSTWTRGICPLKLPIPGGNYQQGSARFTIPLNGLGSYPSRKPMTCALIVQLKFTDVYLTLEQDEINAYSSLTSHIISFFSVYLG